VQKDRIPAGLQRQRLVLPLGRSRSGKKHNPTERKDLPNAKRLPSTKATPDMFCHPPGDGGRPMISQSFDNSRSVQTLVDHLTVELSEPPVLSARKSGQTIGTSACIFASLGDMRRGNDPIVAGCQYPTWGITCAFAVLAVS
jgi:hypothetical protein